MTRLSTYLLKRKSDGVKMRVNQIDYHADLAKYADCERIGETHVEGEVAVGTTAPEATPEPEPEPQAEAKAASKAKAEGPVKTK